MEVEVREIDGVSVVRCVSPIGQDDRATDLVALCLERGSRRLLLDAGMLPAEFFDLSTGWAGELVQKLENYRLRVAVVLPADGKWSERFTEFAREAKRGRSFRVFEVDSEAEKWLASD